MIEYQPDQPEVCRGTGLVYHVTRGHMRGNLGVRALTDFMKCPLSASEIDWLLHQACVDLGYCLPPIENERIRNNPPATTDKFTDAIMVAEGLEPQYNSKLRKSLRALVANYFDRSRHVDC